MTGYMFILASGTKLCHGWTKEPLTSDLILYAKEPESENHSRSTVQFFSSKGIAIRVASGLFRYEKQSHRWLLGEFDLTDATDDGGYWLSAYSGKLLAVHIVEPDL